MIACGALPAGHGNARDAYQSCAVAETNWALARWWARQNPWSTSTGPGLRRSTVRRSEELFSLNPIRSGHNAVLVGPNSIGKIMILKNVAQRALSRGHTVRFTTASDMLAELAARDSSSILARRLRRCTTPQLLCIDEVGYVSYKQRYADLLFEVVTRRYDVQKPALLSTNKAFSECSEVFPHAACVVTLVDRLIHRAEVIDIDADSYSPQGNQGTDRRAHETAKQEAAVLNRWPVHR